MSASQLSFTYDFLMPFSTRYTHGLFSFYSPSSFILMHEGTKVGLDAAGKTTILYKLKLGEVVNTIPTIGM